MRKVVFICNEDYGSNVMRGYQMAAALSNRCRLDATTRPHADGETNSIVVFVKHARPEQVEKARAAGNTVVIDVVDRLAYKVAADEVIAWSMADMLITATGAAERSLSRFHKRVATVLHHWDERLPTIQRERYAAFPYGLRFGYIGMGFNNKEFEALSDVTTIYNPGSWLHMAPMFTCHFGVRNPNDLQGMYKPATKLVTAAALSRTGMVCSKEAANVELLPDDYPYWVGAATLTSVMHTLQKVSDTFGGPIWDEALEMLRAVKAKTDLTPIAHRYADLLRDL